MVADLRVTLVYPDGKRSNVELPINMEIGVIISKLIADSGFPLTDANGLRLKYVLKTDKGETLDINNTLDNAGVMIGETLHLNADVKTTGSLTGMISSFLVNTTGSKDSLADEKIRKIVEDTIRAYAENNSNDEICVDPVFGKPSEDTQFDCDVFMIMPFAEEFLSIYRDYIKETVSDMNYSIKRGDDFFTSHEIMDDIWAGINNCQVVIAECTGRNPNVFYELGIAHTLGKNTILITQRIEDVPFDIRGKRIIEYQENAAGLSQLCKKLTEYLSKAISDVNRS